MWNNSYRDERPVKEIGHREHGGEGDAAASIDPFGNFLRCHTRFFNFGQPTRAALIFRWILPSLFGY